MRKRIVLISVLYLCLLLPSMAVAQSGAVSPSSQPNASGPTTAAPAVVPVALPAVNTVMEEQEAPKLPAPTPQELESGVKINSSERISLDLKGIDIVELFRILSMKMGITIVPSKSVGGRVNIYLNNLDNFHLSFWCQFK